MDDEAKIHAAINRFYQAFALGQGMDELWSHGDEVVTLHPAGGQQSGWREVSAVFNEAMLSDLAKSKIILSNIKIRVVGDFAWAVYWERAELARETGTLTMDARVTNIYERRVDRWVMVHHHASVADLVQLQQLQRLLASAAADPGGHAG